MKKRSQRKGGKGNLGDRVKVEEKVEDFKYLEHILHKKKERETQKICAKPNQSDQIHRLKKHYPLDLSTRFN